MAQLSTLYLVTVVVFLGLDFLGIKLLVRPVFERHIGDLLVPDLRLVPAAAFYLLYVAGVLWFVSVPAVKENAPLQALVGGMVLGFLCYGTYEITNYATLRDWSLQQVAVDMAWGTMLTGFAAWAGVAALAGRLA